MALIRNLNAPASAPGGYTWDTPDDVVEVPDDLADDLIKMPHGGWREVLPEGDPDADEDEAGGVDGLTVEPQEGQTVACPTCSGTGVLAAHLAAGPVGPGGVVLGEPADPDAEQAGDDADEAELEAGTEQGDEPYDPDGQSDEDVLDYLRSDEADEAEVNRVMDLAAGKSGRARKSLTAHREELLAAKRDRTEPVTE